MEKISGIIPSSARVKNVDMKDAHPVRPGVPSFGRPEGVSNLAKNTRLSSIDTMLERPMTDRQRLEYEKSKIVDRVSNGFFMKEPIETPAASVEFSNYIPVDDMQLTSQAQSTPTEEIAPVSTMAQEGDASDPVAEEPEFLRPGSYIDVEV